MFERIARLRPIAIAASSVLLGTLSLGAGPADAADAPLGFFGTASVDGVQTSGEWDGVPAFAFTIDRPGGTTSGEIRVMNDEAMLYILYRLDTSWAADYLVLSNAFEFDNDNDGAGTEEGDDAIVVNASWYPWLGGVQVDTFDDYRTFLPPCPAGLLCGLLDTQGGGTNDVVAAAARDATHVTIEFAHPLDSADGHDFALSVGDGVGWTAFARMFTPELADTTVQLPDIGIAGAQPSVESLFDALVKEATSVGPGTSLADKAAQARAAWSAGDVAGAVETLRALVRQVDAVEGVRLDPTVGAKMKSEALQLIDRLQG
jgi:hypothetical protein